MIRIGTIFALAVAAAGGIAMSQAPEFAQQYRQRLGGALDEMVQVVADFDADAARNGLQREEALAAYEAAGQPFLTDRSRSMRRALDRFEQLSTQARRFETMPAVLRPVILVTGPDSKVAAGAWDDFEPAVPVTPHGLIWAAAGALGGFGAARLIALPFRRGRRAIVRGR